MQMLSNFWWFSITFGIKSKILGVLYNALHGLPPAQITTPHLLLGHNNHNEPIGLPNPYLHVPFSLSVTYMPPPYARDSVYLSPHLRSFPWFLLHLCLSQAGLGATPLGFSTTWGLAPLLHWPYLFSRFVCLSYSWGLGWDLHAQHSGWHKAGPTKCWPSKCIKPRRSWER